MYSRSIYMMTQTWWHSRFKFILYSELKYTGFQSRCYQNLTVKSFRNFPQRLIDKLAQIRRKTCWLEQLSKYFIAPFKIVVNMNISANFKLFRFERAIAKKKNLQILTCFKIVHGHFSYQKTVCTDRFP